MCFGVFVRWRVVYRCVFSALEQPTAVARALKILLKIEDVIEGVIDDWLNT